MYTIGNPFVVLESVDSTNNYAMAKVHAGLAKHGETYFAMHQTAGKGQRGKTWNSGVAENLILSCIIDPGLVTLESQVQLSITIALACYDFVNHYTLNDTTIKWPNDLYWRDRKAGGILIENSVRGGKWQFAIAGVGININQTSFPAGLLSAVSLKQVTGRTYDIISLARELCDRIQARILASNVNNFEEYNSLLYKKNERVLLRENGVAFEATVKSVSPEGQLVTFTNRERRFSWGSIEWVT